MQCWKDSSRNIWLVGLVNFTALLLSSMRGRMVAFEARPRLMIE